MKIVSVVCLLACACAQGQISITFTNKGGDRISNAPLVSVTGTMLYYELPGGGAGVKLADLPPALQKQIGYEPGKAEARPVHNVTGGFGFKLGAVLDYSRRCSFRDTNGDVVTEVFMTTNYPPFSAVTVAMLKDRRIFLISAKYKGDNWREIRGSIVADMTVTFGPPRRVDAFGADATEWGDYHRNVSIGDQTVDYVDMDLLKVSTGRK